MANCPKCGGTSDHPLKTWKIKQTPIALYECPSCKTKWRGKTLTESAFVQPAALVALPTMSTTSLPSTEVAEKIGAMKPVEVAVKSTYVAPSRPSSPFAGIRKFFSSILA